MIIDFSVLDTTPAGSSFCSPPAGWEGDEAAYTQWLRERYRADRGFAQYMHVAARITCYHASPERSNLAGPFASPLKDALVKLWEG